MTSQLIRDFFDNSVHIGHRTQRWNPKMKKFLYGELDGYHIINLEKTLVFFEKAVQFLSKSVSEGKTILFVSTKPQSTKLIEKVANDCKMPYVSSKWIPGLISNFSTVKTRIKYLEELMEQESSGEFSKYSKKEVSQLKKTISKLLAALGGVRSLKREPDIVFVLDPVRDFIAVKEANKCNIPVVALVDSNADPDYIDYPIPANDDALSALEVIFTNIVDSLKKSK